ncbi:MAG: ACT domain-containing protein [Clostridia bacterium]|nr:ACT domain-containing protein [Clostridia bacterium]
MKAVITVLGKDTVGILAKVSAFCAERNMNVVEVTQSVLQDMFAMVMLVEVDREKVTSFEKLNADFDALGQSIGTKIHIMHEDIFNSMHKI